jgi:nitrate/TMAO reductase-like tetraheme cytochrome c subunit
MMPGREGSRRGSRHGPSRDRRVPESGSASRVVMGGGPALLIVLAPAVAVALELDEGVPLPKGWIGTADQWIAGMGIAFALLNLVLLVFAWRRLGPAGLTPTARGWLFVAVGLVPTMVAVFTFVHGLESSSTVAACGFCHVMKPYVADLRDVNSNTLAAVHAKNRYIRDRHCYTCHSDYGLAGTAMAKLGGLGHVVRYTTGAYTLPLTIARPYPNVRCLGCHAGALKFVKSRAHPKMLMDVLMDGSTSCLVCHKPAHPREKKVATS